FTDAGGRVIEFLQHLPKFKNYTIIQLIEYIAHIYVNDWGAKLHPFFLNSTITQPAYKGDRKIQETLDYFTSLVEGTAFHKEGYCRITGTKSKLFSAGRHNHILAGSGTFINFNIDLQSGFYVRKEVLFRMFFVPFGTHRLADKIALITSNNPKVSDYFIYQNCLANLELLALNTSEGVLKSPMNNPANAIFRFAENYVQQIQSSLNNEEQHLFDTIESSLILYHFSNMGQKPEFSIYSLDSKAFRFYSDLSKGQYCDQWKKFVNAHYKPDKKAFFDNESGKWERKGEEITFEEYSKWKNFVLNGLINNTSVVRYFLTWSEHNYFPFSIVKFYQTELRNMKKEHIDKIKAIADFIVTNCTEDLVAKYIGDLNKAMTRAEFQKTMLKLQTVSYEQKSDKPLLTIDEYSELFSQDSNSWVEIRNLMVIGVYQKLHEA
ncbi:MAG TPA: type I-B CRISPR-associated protein Cas8b1/Cst1, partial [Puia sp.]|nr:type I-B CRISPR-associated protein Cas8b1/Cst1 [Puia sp.]